MFSFSGSPSEHTRKVLDEALSNYEEELRLIAATVYHNPDIEVGAALSSNTSFATGSKNKVSIPVRGDDAIHVHTHPTMKWRPSRKDIRQVADNTGKAIVLTTNGLDKDEGGSVFGSVIAIPDDLELGELVSIRNLRRDGYVSKITGEPPTDETTLEKARNRGLIQD